MRRCTPCHIDETRVLPPELQKAIDEQLAAQNQTSAEDSLSETAALNIKEALEKAFAAAGLSLDELDGATTKSLEKCLTTVLAAGGLPEGYSCLTSTGKDGTDLTDTLNTILEQVSFQN